MRGTKRTTITAIVMLLVAGQALASGFNIYEAGAKATALGGAFTATADDGSAIFYNPAGLAFLEGAGMDLNLMPVVPGAEFTGAESIVGDVSYGSGKTVDQSFPIPGLYGWRNTGDLAYGIGVSAPFGLGVEWADPATWPGRELSYDVDLATIYISPVVAWKVSPKVAMSMGVDIAFTSIELNRFSIQEVAGEATPYNVIDAKIEGDSELNFTPVFGAMIKATDKLTFGAMYHHSKKMSVKDGKMTLTNVAPDDLRDTVDATILALGGAEHEGKTKLHLPHILSLGAAYQFTPKLRAEIDMVHFGWSTFSELALDFGSEALNQVIEEGYEDIWQFRAGASYQVSDKLLAMVGYVKDPTPQPTESVSPLLPDNDRNDYSFGLAYAVNDRLTITGTYMAVIFDERSTVIDGEHISFDPEINPPGSYDSFADIFGIGFGYKF